MVDGCFEDGFSMVKLGAAGLWPARAAVMGEIGPQPLPDGRHQLCIW